MNIPISLLGRLDPIKIKAIYEAGVSTANRDKMVEIENIRILLRVYKTILLIV